MKYYLHSLCFLKPEEPSYSVNMVESEEPDGNHELGVVFPMDDHNVGVWSDRGDIQEGVVSMLKAARANVMKQYVIDQEALKRIEDMAQRTTKEYNRGMKTECEIDRYVLYVELNKQRVLVKELQEKVKNLASFADNTLSTLEKKLYFDELSKLKDIIPQLRPMLKKIYHSIGSAFKVPT